MDDSYYYFLDSTIFLQFHLTQLENMVINTIMVFSSFQPTLQNEPVFQKNKIRSTSEKDEEHYQTRIQ